MGYDITFHAISQLELERYVFDVLRDPSLVEERAAEITSDPEKQERIKTAIYRESLLPWFTNEKDGDGDPITNYNFAHTIAFGIAILSGYLHPYWYSRNGALRLAQGDHPNVGDLFTSYTALPNSPLSKFTEARDVKMLNGSYTGSSVITDIQALKTWVDERAEYLSQDFEADGFDSLNQAIDYCLQNELWFIEGTEVCIPISDQCFSDFDNFKAHFLKT